MLKTEILVGPPTGSKRGQGHAPRPRDRVAEKSAVRLRSEEHTSELQSRQYLVCRLLLEKKHFPDEITLRALRRARGPTPPSRRTIPARLSPGLAAVESFFFNDAASPEKHTLSLTDALPN